MVPSTEAACIASLYSHCWVMWHQESGLPVTWIRHLPNSMENSGPLAKHTRCLDCQWGHMVGSGQLFILFGGLLHLSNYCPFLSCCHSHMGGCIDVQGSDIPYKCASCLPRSDGDAILMLTIRPAETGGLQQEWDLLWPGMS